MPAPALIAVLPQNSHVRLCLRAGIASDAHRNKKSMDGSTLAGHVRARYNKLGTWLESLPKEERTLVLKLARKWRREMEAIFGKGIVGRLKRWAREKRPEQLRVMAMRSAAIARRKDHEEHIRNTVAPRRATKWSALLTSEGKGYTAEFLKEQLDVFRFVDGKKPSPRSQNKLDLMRCLAALIALDNQPAKDVSMDALVAAYNDVRARACATAHALGHRGSDALRPSVCPLLLSSRSAERPTPTPTRTSGRSGPLLLALAGARRNGSTPASSTCA